jgi:hypothetical protein
MTDKIPEEPFHGPIFVRFTVMERYQRGNVGGLQRIRQLGGKGEFRRTGIAWQHESRPTELQTPNQQKKSGEVECGFQLEEAESQDT